MKEPYLALRKKLKFFSKANENYKKLRKHLNKQPVGYPATITGVELRLLKEIFTAEEAGAALNLDYKSESFETIWERAMDNDYDEDGFRLLLESMEKKGAIFVKYKNDKAYYALHPFAIGMFEMQIKRLTPGYFLDSHSYMLQQFAMEYLSAEMPQMRVIPINKSLVQNQNVATYDQIREVVNRTKDKICITECICKKGRDLIDDSCRVTDRREICMGFRDFSDTYIRNGWGRAITQSEALEILDKNEKDGLVLFSATMQEPQFVCSCCQCCCGIMEMIQMMPRPVDFAASNFFAKLETETCLGCKKCINRCQMDAINFDEKEKKATGINLKRCIGCGLCVSTCKSNSIELTKKETHFLPPLDQDGLYDVLMQNKKSMVGKFAKMTKAMVGLKV